MGKSTLSLETASAPRLKIPPFRIPLVVRHDTPPEPKTYCLTKLCRQNEDAFRPMDAVYRTDGIINDSRPEWH